MKKVANSKIKHGKQNVGRFMRIRYIDVGVRDELCIAAERFGKVLQYKIVDVHGDENWVESSQVLAVGPRLTIPEFENA